MIWVAVGGRGTLVGAVLGAVLVNVAKTYFTGGMLATYWLFVLGGLFVARHAVPAAGHRRHAGRHWRARRSARAGAPTPAPMRRRRRAAAGRVRQRWTSRTTSALLYLDGVTVSLRRLPALNELSLAVEPGEMRAIIGPNGAGKTTMMDVITGKTRPDEGDVLFRRRASTSPRLDEAEIAELGIGRKFQKPTVFESHTRRGQSASWR